MGTNGTPSTGSPTVRRPPTTKATPTEDDRKVSSGEDAALKSFSHLRIINDDASIYHQKQSSVSEKENQITKAKLDAEPSHMVDGLLKHIENSDTRHPLPRKPANGFMATNVIGTLSMPPTPAVENVSITPGNVRPASTNAKDNHVADDEVARLQQQLAAAQSKIYQLEGIGQVRDSNTDNMRASPFESKYEDGSSRPSDTSALPFINSGSWPGCEEIRSENSEPLSINGFNRTRHIWNGAKPNQPSGGMSGTEVPGNANPWTSRGSNSMFVEAGMPYNPAPGSDPYRASDRMSPDYDMGIRGPNNRRTGRFDRFGAFPAYGNQGPYGGGSNFNNQYGQGPFEGGPSQNGQYGIAAAPFPNQQPGAIGTALSPLATEFTSGNGHYRSEPTVSEGPTYLPTTEPLNYRRLLDRNVNCNWKYIVDKIVCNNDQQASIFLQQKLKVGTPDQKYEIVDAIILQSHPLMVNRFGNFLVQRCFEHGTPEQVIKIAESIRGNTLSLSMDPFGCHVVQKALDSVPEDYKAVMVHELLRRIPETIIHRYACHVWQKLFELRWSESPPQIMKYVNESLRGMWHEVALGETGSLVVQNIFENCLEEDKRPCIEEVLANIDIVAHGQFGNWCIQHICEHGAPADRSRAIDHVIRYAAEYSMDQYASKVVEKCLKIGGGDFLGRYLDRVCEGRVDRPRIPLIDIASDQYGNYLIQWVLTQGNPQHREIVAAHIRKHMVSLRGSKFGSRVGMLCTNPAIATRPGPGINPNLGRLPGPRYGRPYP
ncbi:hypothetical protein G7054_g13641 [Neopestalotiopsis clavispora]|nr:hypothetical protein G7054_g13641 [Neopestalotiopsis clavispora]